MRFRAEDDPDARPRPATTGDIGVGGVFIECHDPPAVGSRLAIAIELPGSHTPIEVSGEVRWTADEQSAPPGRTAGMGIKFLALDVDTLLALTELFSRMSAVEDRKAHSET